MKVWYTKVVIVDTSIHTKHTMCVLHTSLASPTQPINNTNPIANHHCTSPPTNKPLHLPRPRHSLQQLALLWQHMNDGSAFFTHHFSTDQQLSMVYHGVHVN